MVRLPDCYASLPITMPSRPLGRIASNRWMNSSDAVSKHALNEEAISGEFWVQDSKKKAQYTSLLSMKCEYNLGCNKNAQITKSLFTAEDSSSIILV